MCVCNIQGTYIVLVLTKIGWPKNAGTFSSISECVLMKFNVGSGSVRESLWQEPGRGSGTCNGKDYVYRIALYGMRVYCCKLKVDVQFFFMLMLLTMTLQFSSTFSCCYIAQFQFFPNTATAKERKRWQVYT